MFGYIENQSDVTLTDWTVTGYPPNSDRTMSEVYAFIKFYKFGYGISRNVKFKRLES